MTTIDKPIRLLNYVIDLFLVYLLWMGLFIVLGADASLTVLFYPVFFFYYFILELSLGQTVGKLISQTKVVCKDGTKPGAMKIAMRSFWRLIPLDVVSYLFGTETGMHDLLSSTRLVKKN